MRESAGMVLENPQSKRAFDSSEMASRGRIGAYATLSRYDARDLTAAARERFLRRFVDEVDPDSELPIEERERRALYARKRYFAELALKSARARRKSESSLAPGVSR
jgi:hypothetical protein